GHRTRRSSLRRHRSHRSARRRLHAHGHHHLARARRSRQPRLARRSRHARDRPRPRRRFHAPPQKSSRSRPNRLRSGLTRAFLYFSVARRLTSQGSGLSAGKHRPTISIGEKYHWPSLITASTVDVRASTFPLWRKTAHPDATHVGSFRV